MPFAKSQRRNLVTGSMKFPKKSWSQPKKSPTKRAAIPEDWLQQWTDSFLESRRIRWIRVPDAFWNFLHATAYPGMLAFFRKVFGGWCDNTCFIRIGDDYSLTLHLELKTEDAKGRAVGQLHGKQKAEAKNLPWKICRNHNAVRDVVLQYEREALMLAEVLKVKSISDLYTENCVAGDAQK